MEHRNRRTDSNKTAFSNVILGTMHACESVIISSLLLAYFSPPQTSTLFSLCVLRLFSN